MAFVGGRTSSKGQGPRPRRPMSGALDQLRRDDERQRAREGPAWQGLLWAAVVLVAAIGLLTVAGMALLVYQSDLVLPGVQAGKVYLGGLTRAEAAEAAQGAWTGPTIEVRVDEVTRAVPAEALGIVLDSAAVAQAAHAKSRAAERLEGLLAGGPAVEVGPIWRVDRDGAVRFLEALASEVDVAPVDAGLRIVEGRVEVSPAVTGRSLDVASSLVRLTESIEWVLVTDRFEPVTVRLEPTLAEVEVAAAQASDLLGQMLTLQAYDPVGDETVVWEVAPAVWGGWLETWVDPAAGTLGWEVDVQRAGAYLAAQMEGLAPERYLALPEGVAGMIEAMKSVRWRAEVRIYHHMRQHAVEPGDTLARIGRHYGIPYPWLQQANPWASEGLRAGQMLTIPSPDELLPLPIVAGKRIVVSISQQRMWVYERGGVKWEWAVSTGIESSPTHPGVFQVQSHEPNAYAASWDLWMPHFVGIYRPVPTVDFMNGFHGFPSRGGTQVLWTGNLGRPVTYGCILIHSDNAAALYEWAEEGVIVEVNP
jgi:lipoprotein-anchoring transpeptidase ErfK/SrfK